MRSLFVGLTSALGISQQPGPEVLTSAATTTFDPATSGPPGSYPVNAARADAAGGSAGLALPGGCGDACFFAAEKSPDLPFTTLLVTQNIGGILSGCAARRGGGDKDGAGGEEAGSAPGVPSAVRQRVTEFLAELRLFIYEMCRREITAHHRKDEANAEECLLASATAGSAAENAPPPLLDVIVVHFQEIGGTHMDAEFNAFFATALNSLLPEAAWNSGLLMEPSNDTQRFTALGSIIFLSQRMYSISSILSFQHRTFVSVADDPATYGSSPTILFHGGKFSDAGSSRKGYLLTSLRLGTVIVNFLNVHLYHDVRNTDAVERNPSAYALQRQKALLEAMAECVVFVSPEDPLFIFGDFNTRLEAHSLLRYLKETLQIDVELSVKEVRSPDTFWELFTESQHLQTIRKFDVEMQRLMDVVAQQSGVELAEFAIRFQPTYLRLPVEEKAGGQAGSGGDGDDGDLRQRREREEKKNAEQRDGGTREGTGNNEGGTMRVSARILNAPTRGYTRQRIPAWCDRIVWNPAGLEFVMGRLSSFFSSSSHTFVNKEGGTDAFCRYMYRSFAFKHTDHDCVALLF